MHLVDPIRGRLCRCLHRLTHVFPGMICAHTHANTHMDAHLYEHINTRRASLLKTGKLLGKVGQRIPSILSLISPWISATPPLTPNPTSPLWESDNSGEIMSNPLPSLCTGAPSRRFHNVIFVWLTGFNFLFIWHLSLLWVFYAFVQKDYQWILKRALIQSSSFSWWGFLQKIRLLELNSYNGWPFGSV